MAEQTETERRPQHAPGGSAGLGTLGLILLLAVGLRLLAWSRTLMVFNDGVDFLWQAERLLAGDWRAALGHPYHPLYAASVAALSSLFGDLEAAVAVSVLGGMLVVVACWGAARRLVPDVPVAPAAAALLAATNTRVLNLTSDVLSDGLFLGLSLLACWALLAAAARGACPRRMLAAGLLAGLAYLTRPEGLYPLLLAFAAFPFLHRLPLAARARGLLLSAAGSALFVIPYVLVLHELTGAWGVSLKPSLQLAGLRGDGPLHLLPPAGSPLSWGFIPYDPARHPRLQAADKDEEAGDGESEVREGSFVPLAWLWAVPAQELLRDPARLPDLPTAAMRTLRKLIETVRLETWLFVLPGLYVLGRRRSGAVLAMLAAVGGWLALLTWQVHTSGYVTNRHMTLALTFLLPAGGVGLLLMMSRGLLLPLVAGLALLASVDAGTRPRREDNGPRLQALAWIAANTPADHAFATQRRRDGFYAGRPAISTRFPCDQAALARRIARGDVDWLVYDEQKLAEHHPDWLPSGQVEEVLRFEGDGETVLVLRPRFGAR